MKTAAISSSSFHAAKDSALVSNNFIPVVGNETFDYTFQVYFHPFLAELIQKLNDTSVGGMLDPGFLGGLNVPVTEYTLDTGEQDQPPAPVVVGDYVNVVINPKNIDTLSSGPYANYNWELLYHIPMAVAVHLSSNQRFAEAQKWFHLVFDPTSTDPTTPPPDRFWRSFVFRNGPAIRSIQDLLTLLSTPDSQLTDQSDIDAKKAVLKGYDAILANPFQPHLVAASRPSAYQWYVVMKYLDNLIAWGDSLFLQDTVETINEATLCYVLAANILGPRPQAVPQLGTRSPKNFLQMKQAGLDTMGNALVELESQFPFNGLPGSGSVPGTGDLSGALFGMVQSLYFCVPQNQTLLAYWDTVADRLFKIRNSENIQGVAQQLPLFDPPLDPGMLVKAAAAGIDIGSIVSGLNQPLGPVRAPFLIQKAQEVAAEVRSLGNALLSAFEKVDAENLALLRQSHEIELQQLTQNVRFLQLQHAQETTTGLLRTRASALERYTYYLRLLGLSPDPSTVPATFSLDRRELNESNFDDAYAALVAAYDQPVALQAFAALQLAQGSSPSNQAGASGSGSLYLNQNEDKELNTHLPTARDTRFSSGVSTILAGSLTPIPSAEAHLAFWGMGVHSNLFSGQTVGAVAKIAAEVLQIAATYETDKAGIASRTAGYQRRADEWMLQANLAARELMQIGRQLLASLIAEQVASHEYQNVKTQVKQAQEIQSFLQTKFTNAVFYQWMQSEIAGLYYQYYRFACDTARRAEATMKQELMRPELDATNFIQFNYWDTGHKGLLSGEALYLDIKRMELAYHDNNKRELELTRHVSLRQLDPVALLALKVTGSCTVTIPEWLYDRDCPGHYLRRIKNVSLTVPSVVGPYTSLNCTLTLESSSVRTSPLLANGVYARDPQNEDDRFVDYFGSTDVIVTSGGNNDAGMFETNLRDDRFLPFEGQGAISTWNISLPAQLRAFDYTTISDLILHVRYTARPAGDPLGATATKELAAMLDTAGASGQGLLFCLCYDFPSEWAAFVNGGGAFQAVLQKSYFPYAVQSAARLTINALSLYSGDGTSLSSTTPEVNLAALSSGLTSAAANAVLNIPTDGKVLTPTAGQVFLLLQYSFGTL